MLQGTAGSWLDGRGEGGRHQVANRQDDDQQLMENSHTKVYTVYVLYMYVH